MSSLCDDITEMLIQAQIADAIKLAVSKERERCAQVCERLEREETATEGFTTIDSYRYDKAAEEIRKGSDDNAVPNEA